MSDAIAICSTTDRFWSLESGCPAVLIIPITAIATALS